MTGGQHSFIQRLRQFLSPAEELGAGNLKGWSCDCDANSPSERRDRSRVKAWGAVRWVTSLSMGGVEVLLADGMGSIELNWTGHRRLDCITPSCDLVVQDRIFSGDNGRIMYNPRFEVVS